MSTQLSASAEIRHVEAHKHSGILERAATGVRVLRAAGVTADTWDREAAGVTLRR